MFIDMTDIELLNFCEDNFSKYAVCQALKCEDNCKNEDCPLTQLFCRFKKYMSLKGVDVKKDYFTPDDVRRMTSKDVRDNYASILQSMKKW